MSVFACSDLHGRYDLYLQIREFLKPEDKVICLGDCADRGPDGWETVLAVYNDPLFDYLLGNHEHLLAYAMLQYLDGRSDYYVDALKDCANNGGLSTLEGWIEDGMDRGWISRLLNLPRVLTYKNKNGVHINLTHAGFTPGKERYSTEDLIWGRDHMKEDWPKEGKFYNHLIVHGHTPIQLVDKQADGIIWYAQDHKVDIDCGSVWSGVSCLLDLDTFDEHYFKSDETIEKLMN